MQHPPRQRLSSNAVVVSCDLTECKIADALIEEINTDKSTSRK